MAKLVLRLVKTRCIAQVRDIGNPTLRLGGVFVDPAGDVHVRQKFKFCTRLKAGNEQPAWHDPGKIDRDFYIMDVKPGHAGQFFAAMILSEHNISGGLNEYCDNLARDLAARINAFNSGQGGTLISTGDASDLDHAFGQAFAAAMKKHLEQSLTAGRLAELLTRGAAVILGALAQKAGLDDAFCEQTEKLFSDLFELLSHGRVDDLEARAKARKKQIMNKVQTFLDSMPGVPEDLENEIKEQIEKQLDQLIADLKNLTDEQMNKAAEAFVKCAADLLWRLMARAMAWRSLRNASRIVDSAIKTNPVIGALFKTVIAAVADNLLEWIEEQVEDRIFPPHLAGAALPADPKAWKPVDNPGPEVAWTENPVLGDTVQIAEFTGFGGHYEIHYQWLLG